MRIHANSGVVCFPTNRFDEFDSQENLTNNCLDLSNFRALCHVLVYKDSTKARFCFGDMRNYSTST